MDWFAIATMAMKLGIKLIPIAEEIFKDEPKSGVKKKALVESGVKTAIDVVEAMSTGGQKETWAKIKIPLSLAVDAACAAIYAKEEE